MVLILGEPVGRRLVQIPIESLTTSVEGKHYHIRIETEGVIDEQKVADVLVNGLWSNFKAGVKYIRIDDRNIDIQLEGSPFEWAALLPWIPSILGAFGIVVTLIAVFGIISAIPRWAWATLTIGLVLLFFGPTIGRSLVKPAKKKR